MVQRCGVSGREAIGGKGEVANGMDIKDRGEDWEDALGGRK